MDNKYFIIFLNLFTHKHSINLIDNNLNSIIGSYSIDEIIDNICQLCEEYQVYNIKINNVKQFSEGLIADIKTKESLLYGKNKINIEVI